VEKRRSGSRAALARAGFLAAMICAAAAALALAATPIWSGAAELSLPSNTVTAAGAQDAGLGGVACSSPGNCVAVGAYRYNHTPSNFTAMIATTQAAGAWGTPVVIAPPSDAATSSNPTPTLTAVSCPAPGSCVAVGRYRDNNAPYREQALVATQTNGTWAQATKLTLPGDAIGAGQDAALTGVSCASVGTCLAVGYYANTTNGYVPLIATQSAGGAWSSVIGPFPSGAVTAMNSTNIELFGVACASASSCTAVGDYVESGGSFQAQVATGTVSGISATSELTLPGDQATTPGDQHALLDAVSCPSVGNCVAAGQYVDTSDDQEAMTATQSGGGSFAATALGLPTGAQTTPGSEIASLGAVSCSGVGECSVVGQYADSQASTQAMIATRTGGGAFSGAGELSLPSNHATGAGQQNAGLNAVSCSAAASCTSTGYYTDSNGANDFQAMVAGALPPLSVTTATLPAASAGTPSRAQLATAGGDGNDAWAITAGALPAGLTLNAATGVISGAPTAIGQAQFTATASDPGPPSQTAGAQLSLLVGKPPAPNTVLRGAHVTRKKKLKVTFTFSATGQLTAYACALERVRGKHKRFSTPHFGPCASPKTYKHLRPGTYRFLVRASGFGGPDPTPASHVFKIR